jgi:hypothetical protein
MLCTASGELLGIDKSIHGGLYDLTDASQGIFLGGDLLSDCKRRFVGLYCAIYPYVRLL